MKKRKRKQVKESLWEDAASYVVVLKALPDIVYKIDPNGFFTFINDSVRSLGYEPEDIIGKHLSEIVHHDDVKIFTRAFVLPKYKGRKIGDEKAPKLLDERRTGERRTKDLEIRLLPKKKKKIKDRREIIGKVIAIGDVSSGGHYDIDKETKGKKFLGTLGIIRDITDRKQAEHDLQKSLEKLERILKETVSALASTIEMRDPYTAGHQRRVANLAIAIAREMGVSKEQIKGIHMAAIIHDIGKIHIPAEILSKPAKLTDAEFAIVKTHSKAGCDILKTIEFPWRVADVILQHHERLDGSGYPQGLKDGDIFPEATMLAVADVVEAMFSHRPYRPACGLEATLDEISKNKGVLYDTRVVDACMILLKEKRFKFK